MLFLDSCLYLKKVSKLTTFCNKFIEFDSLGDAFSIYLIWETADLKDSEFMSNDINSNNFYSSKFKKCLLLVIGFCR